MRFLSCLAVILMVVGSGCTSPCRSDDDCGPGSVCVSTGGVLFGPTTCVDDDAPAADAGGDADQTDQGDQGMPGPDADTGTDASGPSCDDRTTNGGESDVDCGGPCEGCRDGESCDVAEDCLSGLCDEDRCVSGGCDNGLRDGDETGTDCGGPCEACPNGEACEEHEDCASGICAEARCVPFAPSCRELNEAGLPSGEYQLDPGLDGLPDDTFVCNQEIDGGGWTVIDRCTALEILGGELVVIDDANVMTIEEMECRPVSRDGSQNHTMYFEFMFAAGFEEFRLLDYRMKANATLAGQSDIDPDEFVQTSWDVAFGAATGDVSFGSGEASGPATSYAAAGATVSCVNCLTDWPLPDQTFEVDRSETFRIGFGEAGPEAEGWYPWWDGVILLR